MRLPSEVQVRTSELQVRRPASLEAVLQHVPDLHLKRGLLDGDDGEAVAVLHAVLVVGAGQQVLWDGVVTSEAPVFDSLKAAAEAPTLKTHRHMSTVHTDTCLPFTQTHVYCSHRHMSTDTCLLFTQTQVNCSHRQMSTVHTDTCLRFTQTHVYGSHRHMSTVNTDTCLQTRLLFTQTHVYRHMSTVHTETCLPFTQTQVYCSNRHMSTDTCLPFTQTQVYCSDTCLQTHVYCSHRHRSTVHTDTGLLFTQTHVYCSHRHMSTVHTDTCLRVTQTHVYRSHRHVYSSHRHVSTGHTSTCLWPTQTHVYGSHRHMSTVLNAANTQTHVYGSNKPGFLKHPWLFHDQTQLFHDSTFLFGGTKVPYVGLTQLFAQIILWSRCTVFFHHLNENSRKSFFQYRMTFPWLWTYNKIFHAFSRRGFSP